MENYLTQIINYLLTQSWQIAVLAVVIAVASLALKNKSAHARYLLWLIILAKCLVPPLLTIPLAVLPERGPTAAFEPVAAHPVEPAVVPAAPVAVVPEVIAVRQTRKLTPRQWLGFGWIVGVAAFLLFALIKALRTNSWLRRQRKPLPAELQTWIENLLTSLGIKTFPKVWLVEGIGQPFVWGLLRGSIYLPADFAKVDNAEHRRGVLGHELSHILRFDAAVNLLQVIVQAIFWFHPFVWCANKKIRAEREKCCDEMAIARLGAKVRDYSIAIVNTLVVEHESTRPVPSLAIAGPVKNIEERIKTIMRPGKKFYRRPSLAAAIAVLLLALLTVPTTLMLTARAETEAAAEPEPKPAKSLRQAAADGDIEQVKSLISKGADVNAKDKWGWTPLQLAARGGHRSIAELLLSAGADINATDAKNNTPLILATNSGHKEVVKVLIAQGADLEAHGQNNSTALHFTAAWGHREIAEVLIAAGADVNARQFMGATSLHLAAQNANYDLVSLLTDKGADVNARWDGGGTPLEDATQWGSPEHQRIVRLLVDRGAVVRSPIHTDAYLGDVDAVKRFLETGKNVNTKDYSGRTPLHCAATTGQFSVAELLLAEGASVDARTGGNETPLHTASSYGHPDVAELLIAKGADVNAKDDDDDTPLHVISWRITSWRNYPGNVAVARLLVEKGADVNARNKEGRTPLHEAADDGFKDLVQELLEKGVDINARDKEGRTALSLAKEKGHTEIVELLRMHEAKEDSIKIDARFLLVSSDAREVKDFLERENVESAHIPGGPNTRVYVLNAGQVEQLLELARLNTDYKLLMNPTLEVLDGKTAMIRSSQRYNYVSGYSEPNRPSEEPKPIRDSVDIGDRLQVKPKLQPNSQDTMEVYFEFEISNFAGHEKYMYKGKYPYEIPIIEKIATAINYKVDAGETMLLCGWKITSYRNDGRTEKKEQDLLVLITTQKVEPKNAKDGAEIVEVRYKNGEKE